MSAPMRRLGSAGRFRLYFAKPGEFVRPGVHLWTGRRHVRLIPLRRRDRK